MLNFTHEYARRLGSNLNSDSLPSPRQNQLLALLPDELYERIEPELELMEMPAGMSLYIPGDARIYAYFPTTCIISILYDTESGKSSQIALTGNRSEEHTSELQSLMRISYAVFCLKQKNKYTVTKSTQTMITHI